MSRPYAFTPRVEVRVAYCCAASVAFWESIGHALDPERMVSEAGKLLVGAAREAAALCSGQPASPDLVLQVLSTRMENGKLSLSKYKLAAEMLQVGEDIEAAVEVDELMAIVLPVVTAEARQSALEEAISDHGKGAAIDGVIERFEAVASLGKRRQRSGSVLSGSEEELLRVAAGRDRKGRLATGVAEVDMLLLGGMEKKALGVALAGTGGGKSLSLCSFAVEAMLAGIDTAYLTMELPEDEVKVRVYCNLVDMTPDEIQCAPEKAAARLVQLREVGALGQLAIRYDSPMCVTPAEVRRWVTRDLPRAGVRPKLVIVDYADLMISKAGTDKHSYEDMRIVYAGLRDVAVDIDGWMWTASQANRGTSGKKQLNVDNAADSINKMRIADLVLAISRTAEDEAGGMVRFSVPKRRVDEAHGQAGPIPMDAARGRIAIVSRTYPWA